MSTEASDLRSNVAGSPTDSGPAEVAASLAQSYMRAQPREAAEVRGIALQAWERLDRCVDNVENTESNPSSWVPALYGTSVTSLLGMIPEGLTGHGTGRWIALVLFGAVGLFSAVAGRIVQRIENEGVEHHRSHTTILRTEFTAAANYMVEAVEVESPK